MFKYNALFSEDSESDAGDVRYKCLQPLSRLAHDRFGATLAPVQEPDTFAEGAWDKLTKTEGTFNFKFKLSLQF